MPFEANISLNKIASSISHTLGDSENFYLKEKIKFEAIQFRNLLLRRDLERNFITRNFIQYICDDLICVDLSTCCDSKSYDTALRTKNVMPIPLRTKDYDSFYFVGDISKKNAFKEVSFDNIDLMAERRFTKNKTLFIYSEYVYIINPPTDDFNKLGIGSVWENPQQLAGFSNCDGVNCYTDDDTFPMGGDQYPALEEYLLKTIGNFKYDDDKQIKINED